MPMIKKASILEHVPTTATDSSAVTSLESGAKAAVERLSNPTPKAEPKPAYKPRDFEAEAIGKTRCVQFEAALMSPAIAGMRFDTMEEYLKLVRQAAEAGVAFSFEGR